MVHAKSIFLSYISIEFIYFALVRKYCKNIPSSWWKAGEPSHVYQCSTILILKEPAQKNRFSSHLSLQVLAVQRRLKKCPKQGEEIFNLLMAELLLALVQHALLFYFSVNYHLFNMFHRQGIFPRVFLFLHLYYEFYVLNSLFLI